MDAYKQTCRKHAPRFSCGEDTLVKAFEMALDNLLLTNTVSCPAEKFNKTGLLDTELGMMIRAGGGYGQPWTRDAAVNTMNAACFLEPEVAKNTLLSVCQLDADGEVVVQKDNQQWDKIIWVLGAWKYYLATHDTVFLKLAYGAGLRTMAEREQNALDKTYGLFTGGAFFQDGIAGYPQDLYSEGSCEQFMGKHPLVAGIMSLSVNCIYYAAYKALGAMGRELGMSSSQAFADKAQALKDAVQKYLWDEARGTFCYLLYPDGRTCKAQEGCGISFAILSEICSDVQARRMLDGAYRSKHGIMAVWPPFAGTSSEEKPARHNNLVWPFINGYFMTAAAKHARADLLADELRQMAELAVESGEFREIYHPETGEPYGGWQCGRFWDSFRDQTWSATAYIRGVVFGLFGVQLGVDAVRFCPCLPDGFDGAKLMSLRLRGLDMDIELHGAGTNIQAMFVNGKPTTEISFEKSGHYDVVIEMTH